MRPSGSAQAVWHSRGEGPESASTSTRSQALEEVIQLKNEEKKKNMQKIKHSRKRGRRTHIKQGGRYTESDNVAMQHRRTQIKSVRINQATGTQASQINNNQIKFVCPGEAVTKTKNRGGWRCEQ
jgi:hypothetical protein